MVSRPLARRGSRVDGRGLTYFGLSLFHNNGKCVFWIDGGQMAFAPMAICFQFVPSLKARHWTELVPPALRWMIAPTHLAGVRPAAVSDATFVKARPFRFSCSPKRIFSKLRGNSLLIFFMNS